MSEYNYDDLIGTLPNLRRYAFGLMGSRARGDDLIEAFLRELVQTKNPISGSSISMSLFKAFHESRVVSEYSDTSGAIESCRDHDLHARILAIPLADRMALLLVTTIGFSDAQASEILGRPRDWIVSRVCRAGIQLNKCRNPKKYIVASPLRTPEPQIS